MFIAWVMLKEYMRGGEIVQVELISSIKSLGLIKLQGQGGGMGKLDGVSDELQYKMRNN